MGVVVDGMVSQPVARPLAATASRRRPPPPARRRVLGYSLFVNTLKFLLPMLAVLLLALVALWPHLQTQDLRFRIGFTAADTSDLEEPSFVNPRYFGTDEDNQSFSITADLARNLVGNESTVDLEMPKADITLEDGTWLVLTANAGVYGRDVQLLDLAGAVNLYHDSGYEFSTETAKIDLLQGMASGDDSVRGQGPFGNLESEGFRIVDKGRTILFTGKSRIVLYSGVDSGIP